MSPRVLATWAFLVLWGAGSTLAIGSLMVNHTVALPEPTDAELLIASARRAVGPTGRLHIVPGNCSCTDRLVEHLLERRAYDTEVVAMVGPSPGRLEQLRGAGYEVVSVAPDQVREQLGVVAAPIWVDLHLEEVRYAGGYFARPAAAHPLLIDYLRRLDRGDRVPPLPIYGCAVDATLAQQLDPLGLGATAE